SLFPYTTLFRSRFDVPAQSVQVSGAANVACDDVTCFGVHFYVVTAWHRHLELHPELGSSGARRLRRKHPGNFYSRRTGLCLERISIKKLLGGSAAGIGLD